MPLFGAAYSQLRGLIIQFKWLFFSLNVCGQECNRIECNGNHSMVVDIIFIFSTDIVVPVENRIVAQPSARAARGRSVSIGISSFTSLPRLSL